MVDSRISHLDEARDRIRELFVIACRDGRQSVRLPDEYVACGQYLNDSGSAQRGLHGTAAAIRVLAGNNHDDLLRSLVSYVINWRRLELESGKLADKIEQDYHNVIKQAELLYSISFVPQAVQGTGDASRTLASRLLEGKSQDGKGWCYFLDSVEKLSAPLPTVHAVQALAAHGVRSELRQPIDYLLEHLEQKGGESSDAFIRAQILFVLAYVPGNVLRRPRTDRIVKAAFATVWQSLESVLDHDIEFNIEYARGNRHLYVRVPWQLFLIGAASKIQPRYFASRRAQDRLNAAIKAASSTRGFFYPHSGRRVSSRTNAILFDVLEKIKKEHEKMRLFRLWLYKRVDMVRTWARSSFGTVAGLLIGAGAIIWAIVRVLVSAEGFVDELASGIVVAFFAGTAALFLGLAKRF